MLWVATFIAAVCVAVGLWLSRLRWKLGRLGKADLTSTLRKTLVAGGQGRTVCFQGISDQPAVLVSRVSSGPDEGVYLTLMGKGLAQEQIDSLRDAMSRQNVVFDVKRVGLRSGQPVAEFQLLEGDLGAPLLGKLVRVALEAAGLEEGDWFVSTRHSPAR
jgi:hypothetical protein